MRERAEKKRWQDYVASILWSIGRIVGGEEYPFPEYTEYMNPELKDDRTADDIISGIVDKLNAGR